MKLEYLYLDGYKSLKKVSLSFKEQESSASVNFLIGQNGSGKSSLLEAIGLIFSRIMQEEVPGFEFKIRYHMPDGTIIQVMSDIQEKMDGKLRVEIKKQGETIQTNKIPNEYLPDRMVSYCSGANHSMEEILLKSSKEALVEELYDLSLLEEEADNQQVNKILAYCEQLENNPKVLSLDAETSKFILPVLFSVFPLDLYEKDNRKEAWEYCRLREMLLKRMSRKMIPSAFSFRVHREVLERSGDLPQLNLLERLLGEGKSENGMKADYIKHGWSSGQTGEDGSLLEESTAVFLFQKMDVDLSESYFHPGLQQFFGGNPFMLLSVLLTAHEFGVIDNLEFLYKMENEKGLYSLEALSDGELMWLARTGLVLMAQPYCGENTLFLYDEPDVHFNDDWNKDFMKILYELSKNTHHQFLIATHSTLLLTDARQEQLMLIHQVPGENTEVRPAEISTFAAHRDTIAKEVFHANAIGSYARETVQQMMREKDKKKMEENIGKLGPGFQRFRLYEQYYQLFGEDSELR